jgi:hypothetical protein
MKRFGVFFGLWASIVMTSPASAVQCKTPDIPLKQGSDYSGSRDALISVGWQTPSLSAYGYKEGDAKVVSDCFNSVEICNAYPEIESCSGQGQCMMMFSDAFGNKLEVITYGELGNGAEIISFSIECK